MLETKDHISMGVEKCQSEKIIEIQCVKAAGLLKKISEGSTLQRNVGINDSPSNGSTLTKVFSDVTPSRLVYTITMRRHTETRRRGTEAEAAEWNVQPVTFT